MKTNYLKFALSIVVMMLSLNVMAYEYDFRDGNICYNILSQEEKTCEVTAPGNGGGVSYKGDIVVPSTALYNNVTYTVTSIGRDAFSDEGVYRYGHTPIDNVASVSLPNTITTIKSYAFAGSQILSIFIPKSVQTIENGAFCACPKLKSVYFEDNSTIKEIEYMAFQSCSSLENIELPNSLESLGYSAFEECTKMQSLTIPESITNLGYDVMTNTGWYQKQADGILYIDNCIVGVKNMSSLPSVLNIPEGTRIICQQAFRKSNITSVIIPQSVKAIGPCAFDRCTALTDVYVKWEDTSSLPILYNKWYDNDDPVFSYSSCNLYVPVGANNVYSNAEYWKTFKNIYSMGSTVFYTDNNNVDSNIEVNYGNDFEMVDEWESMIVTHSVDNINLTYTRNFANANVWQGWYVPFDVDYADMASAGYSVAQIQGVLLDNDGNSVIAFMRIGEGDVVKANTPYVVKPNVAGDIELSTTTALQPTETNDFYLMSASDKFTFGGIYDKTTNGTNGWYAMNKTGQFQQLTSDQYLRPFRIYMTIDKRDDNPYAISASANKSIGIMVIGDEATVIDGVTGNDGITTAKAAYNLSGQKVNSLQSGQIYIINGKKYIAK